MPKLTVVMIVVFKHLFVKNYVGLSFWPFIVVKEQVYKTDEVLINHEKIHLQQQKELLVLPFYLWYIVEWLLRCLWYLNTYKAYQNISFEKEAYHHEKDMNYCQNRKFWAFLKFM